MSNILQLSKQFVENQPLNFCSLTTLDMSGVMTKQNLPNIKNLEIYSGFQSFRYVRRLVFLNTDDIAIIKKIFSKAYYIEELEIRDPKIINSRSRTNPASDYNFAFNVKLRKLDIRTRLDDFGDLPNMHIDDLRIDLWSTSDPFPLIRRLRYVKKFYYSFMSVDHSKPMRYSGFPLYDDQRLEKFEVINLSGELFFLDISYLGKRLNYFKIVGFVIKSNTIYENVLTLGVDCSEITRDTFIEYKKWFPNALYININSIRNNRKSDIIEWIYDFYPDAVIEISGNALLSCTPATFRNHVTVLVDFDNIKFYNFRFKKSVSLKLMREKAEVFRLSDFHLDNAKVYSSNDGISYLVRNDVECLDFISLCGKDKINYDNLVDSRSIVLNNAYLLNFTKIPTYSIVYLVIESPKMFKLLIDEKTFPSVEEIIIDGINCVINKNIKKLFATNSKISSTIEVRINENTEITECELGTMSKITFVNSITMKDSFFELSGTILNIDSCYVLEILGNVGDQVILNITNDTSWKFIIKNNKVQFRGKFSICGRKTTLAIDHVSNLDIHMDNVLLNITNSAKIIGRNIHGKLTIYAYDISHEIRRYEINCPRLLVNSSSDTLIVKDQKIANIRDINNYKYKAEQILGDIIKTLGENTYLKGTLYFMAPMYKYPAFIVPF